MNKAKIKLQKLITILMAAMMIATSVPQGVMAAEPIYQGTSENDEIVVDETAPDENTADEIVLDEDSEIDKLSGSEAGDDDQFILSEDEILPEGLSDDEDLLPEEPDDVMGAATDDVMPVYSNGGPIYYRGFTADGGSDENDGYKYLVDNDLNTKWCTSIKGTPTGETGSYWWIDFHSDSPITIDGYSLRTGDDTATYPDRNPRSWVIKAKASESENWTQIAAVEDDNILQATNNTEYVYALDKPGTYQYFRFMISKNTDYINIQLSELALIKSLSDMKYDISVSSVTTGKVTPDVTSTGFGQKVTLTIKPNKGYLPDGIRVYDDNGSEVEVTGGHWYEGNTATFIMPAGPVTVVPSFTTKKTAEDGLYINMLATGTLNAVIPLGVESFKVYDDGGKDGVPTGVCNSDLIITAPSNYRMKFDGSLQTCSSKANDYYSLYEGREKDDSKILLDRIRSTEWLRNERMHSITRFENIFSDGNEVLLYHQSNFADNYFGLDATVSVIPNITYDIAIKKVTGGSVTSETKSRANETVTLTITPDEGYIPTGIRVIDEKGNSIDVEGGEWYQDTAEFRMPIGKVTVTPSFTNKMHTAEDGLFINLPQWGQLKVVIPAWVDSFKVYDYAGADGFYTYCDGSLVCTSPGSVFMVNGCVSTDMAYDTQTDHGLIIYDGDSSEAERIGRFISETNHGAVKDIGTIIGTKESICFNHKGSGTIAFNSFGLDLTVNRLKADENYNLIINNPSAGGTITAVGDTEGIRPGTKVTLNVNNDDGYLLNDLIIKDKNGKNISFTGGLWYSGTDVIAVTMPRSNITVTPVFTKAKTADAGVKAYISSSDLTDITIPAGVRSFSIMESEEFTEKKLLKLTAPSGTKLCITGGAELPEWFRLTLFDGDTTNLKHVISNTDYWRADKNNISKIPLSVSTGNQLKIEIDNTNNEAGIPMNPVRNINLTVDVIDTTEDFSINVESAQGGSVTCSSSAKAGSEVEFTVCPDENTLLSDIKVLTDSGEEISVTGGRWYDSGNTGTFIMPPYPVTIQPVFTTDWSAEGGLFINTPAKFHNRVYTTVVIPEGVRSFKLYDDGGVDNPYMPGVVTGLTVKYPTNKLIGLLGTLDPGADYRTEGEYYSGVFVDGYIPFAVLRNDNIKESYTPDDPDLLYYPAGLVKGEPYDIDTSIDNVDSVFVYFESHEWYLPGEGYDLTVEIFEHSSLEEPPKAISNLKYTGRSQALITPGKAGDGTIYYALVDHEAEAPDASAFSTAIPTAVDAGEYYVWYKVVGKTGYGDQPPAKVSGSVKIAKVDYPHLSDPANLVFTSVDCEVRSECATSLVECALPALPDGAVYSDASITYNANGLITFTDDPANDLENGLLYFSVADKEAGTEAIITADVEFEENYNPCKVIVTVKTVGFNDSIWIENIPAQKYSGSAIKPVPVVHFGDQILTSKDYTVSYKNNTKAADKNEVALSAAPSVIVKGKGNFAGTATETFTISALDIGMAEAQDIILAFNKKDQCGKTAITYALNGKKVTLKEGTDYTLTYEAEDTQNPGNYVACMPHNPGVYRVTVTGKGNYTGTKVFTETIVDPKFMISKVTVPTIPAQMYSGRSFVLEGDQVGTSGLYTRALVKNGTSYTPFSFAIKANGTPLVYGKDYDLTYTDNKEIGTATVTITGKGDYVGARTATFKIDGIKMSSVKNSAKFLSQITAMQLSYQTGAFVPRTQDDYDSGFYYVEGSGKNAVTHRLYEGRDFTAEYFNNSDIGTATVVYTGIGKFYGSITKTFKIVGIDMSKVKNDGRFVDSFMYTGGDITQTGYDSNFYYISGSGQDAKRTNLIKGLDYKVTYTNNREIGTATVVYQGWGIYVGSIKKTFKITGISMSSVKSDGTFKTSFEYNNGRPITQVLYDNRMYYMSGSGKNAVRINLIKDVDYTVEYKNNVDVGTATVVYKGIGKCYGTVTKTFKITGTSLTTMKNDGKFLSSVEYTGAPITQEYDEHFYYETGKKPNVERHDLVKDTDYTVTYSDDHTNIGTVTVIYTGKGKYYGTIKKTFKITGYNMTSMKNDVPFKGSFEYTGSAITQDEYDDGFYYKSGSGTSAVYFELTKNTDYTVTYTNNTEMGTATVTYTGIGRCYGTIKKTFKITGYSMTAMKNDVPFQASVEYTGSAIKQDTYDNGFYYITGTGATAVRHELKPEDDFTVTYTNNITPGTATVTYSGKGKYYGTVKKTFKITGIPMSSVTYPANFDGTTAIFRGHYPYKDYLIKTNTFMYCGAPFEVAGPENANNGFTLSNGGIELKYSDKKTDETTILVNGKDYYITYSNNISSGTASVTFTGKGKYYGSVRKTFKIVPNDLFDGKGENGTCAICLPDATHVWDTDGIYTPKYSFVKGGVRPEPHVAYAMLYDHDTLVNGKDYTLSWTNNTKPGAWNAMNGTKSIAPTVTITFKGNFSGKVSRTFTINPGELGDITTTDLVAQANKTGLYSATKLTLTDAQGNVLKSGTDYYPLTDKNQTTFKFKSFGYGTVSGENAKGNVLIKENNAWVDHEVSVGDPVLPEYCIEAGTEIEVTVHGKGNYEGKEKKDTYLFVGQDLSKAMITIPQMPYKGSAYTADEIGQAMTVTMTKGGTPLVYGTDFKISDLQERADVGTVSVTITSEGLVRSIGEKKATFKIVARTMDYTITYKSNFDKIAEALYNLDAEEHDLDWYKDNYRITPDTMKDSVTTNGGKLTKNTYVLQKKTVVNGKETWKNVPATEVTFVGWNHESSAAVAEYTDQGAFTPSLIERLRFGTHYTLYGIWKVQVQ